MPKNATANSPNSNIGFEAKSVLTNKPVNMHKMFAIFKRNEYMLFSLKFMLCLNFLNLKRKYNIKN